MRVNLFGTAAVIRAALPALKQSRGRIVTVASTLGLRALPDATRVLRLEVRRRRDDPGAGHRARRPGGRDPAGPGRDGTAFFDGRPDQYKPGPDAQLNDPADVADAVAVRADPGERVRAAGDGGLPVHRAVVALSRRPRPDAAGRRSARIASAFRHPGADRGGPVDLAAARRILVVRPDNIGDVVLLTPALRALRAAAPQARIELLASPAGAAVAAMIPELDGVLTVSPNWQQLTAPADADGRRGRRAGRA